MLNELEEFQAYTSFPEYKAERKNVVGYLGRFTFPMLLEFQGFQRVLTVLARGFLFRDGGDGYDRIDSARRALLAWCSIRDDAIKNDPDQGDPRQEARFKVDFREYEAEFPTLVNANGDGWLVQHMENVTRFVLDNPQAVRKEAVRAATSLREGFRPFWAKKVRHLQTPTFSGNSKSKWGLRLDDVLVDALELGSLQNRDFELDPAIADRLATITPSGVPIEASILLYKYYTVHRGRFLAVSSDDSFRAEERPFVVLPSQNFNVWFGTTAFSQKWTSALSGSVIEKKYAEAVTKYRILEHLL